MPRQEEPDNLTREQKIERVKEMLRVSLAMGKKRLSSKTVQDALNVSKPTALGYIQAAERLLAQEGHLGDRPSNIQVPAPVPALATPAQLMPQEPLDRKQQFKLGFDMMGILKNSLLKLEALQSQLRVDLYQVRYIIFGGAEGNVLPGLCLECHRAIENQLTVKQTPKELMGRMGVADIARLYTEIIRAEKNIIDAAKAGNDAMGVFYGFEAIENFMSDVETAILELAPDIAQPFARRMRELAMQRHGGAQ